MTYVQGIQGWLSRSAGNMAASLVRDYYRSLVSLIRDSSLSPDNYDYIWGKLSGVARRTRNYTSPHDEEIYGIAPEEFSGSDHEKVMQILDRQVERINHEKIEHSSSAELLSRVFLWVLEMGTFRYTQLQLNAAKDAIRPLWEQYQFEERYINSEV